MPDDGYMTSVDRALLLSEWAARDGRDHDAACPCCRAWVSTGSRHEPDCPMDLALAERGFHTQEDRDRAREFIARKSVEVALPDD
jgi:hypothetical protein